MIKKVDKLLQEYSYLIFLCTIVVWLGFLPLLEITGQMELIEIFLANLIIISAFYFFYKGNKIYLSYIMTPLAFIAVWSGFIMNDNQMMEQFSRFTMLVLFMFITSHFLKIIFKSKTVSFDVILVSIAGYIMIGIMSSILCWFTFNLYPNAYNIDVEPFGPIYEFTYYSIVTMSTLGYGDIAPQIPQSKSLAMFITLVGQFYMTILMAFLIGKYLNQSNKEK